MGMYDGYTIGGRPGARIPTTQNGALDVNSLIANMLDRTPWAWYDTVKFAPGATLTSSYTLFQQAKGQPDQYNGNQVKTFVETNMLNSGSFNPPYDLLLQRIELSICSVEFQPNDLERRVGVLERRVRFVGLP